MSPQVLALKWRPQVFADLVGQEAVTRTLQNAIRANRLAHAYIFAGPRGVGKTTTARIFAKVLNCRNPKDAEPCNACDLCDEVNQGSSMDVIEIDAASVNGIEGIRTLQEQVGTYPAKGKYKVYIFDEAHRITGPAFDAFLKTLEEPPPHVVFIMASTEIHKFPATVQSRCQRFEFRSMGLETLIKQLRKIADSEKVEADDKTLYQIARSAGGSMRDAQRTLDQLVAFSGKKVTLEDVHLALGTIEGEVFLRVIEAAAKQDAAEGLSVVKGILESGKDLGHFYGGLLETYRHLAVAKAYPSSSSTLIPLPAEEVEKIVSISSRMGEALILSSLRLLIEQEWAVRHSANPQVVLETVVMELCRLEKLTSVGDMILRSQDGASSSISNSAGSPSSPAPTSPTPVVSDPAPIPASEQEGEPVFAVDEIEDPVEAEKNPDMAKLKSRWTEILEKITTQDKALGAVMRDTHPKNIEEGTLVLVCKSLFHLERLSKPESKILVEKLLEEEIGKKVTLVPVLPEGSNPPIPQKLSGPKSPRSYSAPKVDMKELEKEEPLVAAAIKLFGGKIVEVKRNNPRK